VVMLDNHVLLASKRIRVKPGTLNLLLFSQLFPKDHFIFLFCMVCVGRFLICKKIWHQLTFSLSLASLQRDAELVQGLRINHKYNVVSGLSCTGRRTVS